MVMLSGGRKLICIMVAKRNWRVENDHCTVKQAYGNVFNGVVKAYNGF
jgi:hypothetical protein